MTDVTGASYNANDVGIYERKLTQEYGIGVRIHEGNPCWVLDVSKEFHDQSLSNLKREVAKYSAKKCNLDFGFFDMSKPGEPAFSEKEYVWVGLVKVDIPVRGEDLSAKIREFLQNVDEAESVFAKTLNDYSMKLIEVTKKLIDGPQPESIVETLLSAGTR